jgi:tellurite resistance protein TerB
MMEWLKKAAAEGQAAFSAQVSRFRNREFMEAVAAGCAMVAAADGNISAAEKQKMMGFIRLSPDLKVFATEDVIATFTRITEQFDFDVDIGRMEALKVTGKLASNPEAARVMVRVCCVVGASDGNFDGDEKKAVAAICQSVHLDPNAFDLV